MMEYQSWDCCKSVKCNVMIYPKEMRKGLICNTCKAYQMHQWLQEQGYSIVKESTLREENDIQRASIQELSRQLAEAQADNAMLIKSHKEIKWLTNNRKKETKRLINGPMHLNNEQADYNIGQSITDWENVYSQPHPGASLLAELEQLQEGNVKLHSELAKYKRAYEEICRQFNFGDEADYNAMHDCWLDWAELDHIPDTTKMIKEGQDES